MDYRSLGKSGFRVPVLCFGCGTFGGKGPLFSAWGNSTRDEATRLIDLCIDAGAAMFDTADVYSEGASEEILGHAIKGKRDKVILSTKTSLPIGDGPNDFGSSRSRLLKAVDNSLKRLGTDYIDLLQMHAFDSHTPQEEVLGTLDAIVRAGKVRYIGASNFPGWRLMQALDLSEKYGWSKYVAHQAYYSLVGRDYEWELMPLGLDQGVGAIVWSPLGWGRLTGKVRRGQPLPEKSRLHDTANFGPMVREELLYSIVDGIDAIAKETGKTVPQIALNWLASRPTVASIIIGARNEQQLKDNLSAVGWSLTAEQIKRLDDASTVDVPYPMSPYHKKGGGFARLTSPVV